MELLKSEIAKFALATSTNQSASDQEASIENPTVNEDGSAASTLLKNEESTDDLTQYVVSSSSIDLAKATVDKVMKVSDVLAVSESVSTALRSHVIGAFKTLCVSYINTHKKLIKLEKRCEEDRLLSGSLTEQREKGLTDAQKLMETLQKSVETLIADVLYETIPVLVVEVEENETMTPIEGSGLDL